MSLQQLSRDTDGLVREYDYEDATVYAVDVGQEGGSVDVVGDTAIVVVGDEEYDVEVGVDNDVQAFIKNGVLSIQVLEE